MRATKNKHPTAACSAQAHGFARGCGCQRRGTYRLSNGRNYCAQHASIALRRPLTDEEKAS